MRGYIAMLGVMLASTARGETGDAGYRVGVVSESGDVVTWLRPTGICA